MCNNPRHKDRYRLDIIDKRFADLLDDMKPDIVHIGHLNHLSTSLVDEAKKRDIPVVYTLHDYWFDVSARAIFMQMHSAEDDLWAVCDAQENRKCASRCYARYFSGAEDERDLDIAYWENWVARRMAHVRRVVDQVNLFISPSRYLKHRLKMNLTLPSDKSIYLDYGFDRSRMEGRNRISGEPFTFGYIGTHIPAKGIYQLIQAFGKLSGNCQLRIWGKDRGQEVEHLELLPLICHLKSSNKLSGCQSIKINKLQKMSSVTQT